MNQEQAHDLVNQLLISASRTKGEISEFQVGQDAELITDEVGMKIFNELYPYLAGNNKINVVEALYNYSKKEVLEPMDLYNALYLCSLEAPIGVVYTFQTGKQLPDPKKAMMELMLNG